METTFNKGEIHLLVGPATLNVKTGSVEVIATQIDAGQTLLIPDGKRIPVLATETATLELDIKPDNLAKIEASSIPPQWDEVAARVAKEKTAGKLYTIMVLGEVDTGKTFFSTYLANRLIASSGKVAVLDCDSGQSNVGAPGTFGMVILDQPAIFLTELPPTHITFLGAHSPGLHCLPAVSGLAQMLRKAEQEADFLIVDTTGWVQGDGGRAIKRAKLDLAQPDLVILMQCTSELEHLVKHLPPTRVCRIAAAKKATPTDQMQRKNLRERVSRKYFENARVVEIPFEQVYTDRVYFRTGTPVPLEGTLHAERLSGWEGIFAVVSGPPTPELTKSWPTDVPVRTFFSGDEKGLLIALLDANQDVLAVGRLEVIDFLNNRFRVRTSCFESVDLVKGIQFGSLKITEKGDEAGFLEAGLL